MVQSKLRAWITNPASAPALIWRLLTEYAFSHWKHYAVAFVLMAIGAGCTALPAYLMSDFINQAYVNKNFPAIVTLGAIIIVIFLVKGLVTYGQQVILSRIGNHIVAENQRRLFAKLLNESIGFFANRHSSEFAARLMTGAVSANQVISLLVTALGRDLLSLIGLIIVMVVQDPVLSLVTLVVFPPAMIVLRKMIRRIRAVARNQFDGGARVLETMQETLQGIRIIKAFTLEGVAQTRFDKNIGEVERESNKMARVASRSSPLMETLGGIAIALAIVYGGYRVINTGATPGEFFSFITAFLLANEPAKRLARLNLDLHSALVGVRVLYEVIDSPPSEPFDDDKPALTVDASRVEFRNVSFSYRSDEPVIHDISFVAEPGKTTALVGTSGGGKSTLLSLMLRLHEPSAGAIAIDGQNIATVSRKSLRRQIAFVGQDVFLFRGTIRDNIAFGKVGAGENEIIAAAKAAHAHEFIVGFPLGYDTPVGEHGLQLSGGQRQRVAVARALIKDAPIILLDEATAALDSESERLVQDAIAYLCRGRTTIVIAHRLHTIMHSDRILVVEDGAIVEFGQHQELLRKGGRYASFYRLQLQHEEPRKAVAIGSTA